MSDRPPQPNPSRPTSSRAAVAASKPKLKRRRPLIKVDPQDLEPRERTLLERLQEKAVRGWPGLLISFAAHALLLLLFALFVVQQQQKDPVTVVNMAWVVPKPKAPTPTAEATIVKRAPVRIGSISLGPATKSAKPVPKTGTAVKQPKEETVLVKPASVDNALSGRLPQNRQKILQAQGDTEKIERAIDAGLAWLSRQQLPGGNWQLHQGYPNAGLASIRTDTGATALALLAFLGAGHTHQAGEHQQTVARGLRWLVGIQKINGDFHDHSELGRQTAYYAHSQATIAVCEVLAMTGDESFGEPARQAVQFLVDSQHPLNGGWRYQPQSEMTSGDLSVTGWALMALHSARMAGVDVPADAFTRASLFLDSVQERGGSRYKYEPSDPADRISLTMTAEGLLCRQWLGWPADGVALQLGVKHVMQPEHAPEWSAGRRNVYAWYYSAQLLHNLGGTDWANWYSAVQEEIVSHQLRLGSSAKGKDIRGSWSPINPLGANEEYAEKAGRLYVTAMSLLILETPFRHLPLYGEG